ncbi:ring canal kelch homolog [Paramacrobiotus metropolitanus]|uniref:ring canal kelch homolog n=1 Tax=Paramacrobiotus metropolitanus TaxID=2943436 RepID=UPI0024460B8E|nr:ring canal kelch homolog [Paramacrobiotus metropolitanus]
MSLEAPAMELDAALLEDPNYADLSKDFFSELRDLRMAGSFCDVVLKGCENDCDGIPCHRLVLCACSSYFRAMFTSEWKETSQSDIRLKNIQTNTLKEIVRYAYSMEITIDAENVQSVLVAALFLNISSIAKICWNFIERHMSVSNCLMVHCLAELHKNSRLAEETRISVLQHFVQIAQSSDFLLLDAEKIIYLCASDSLEVETEDEVFDAVMHWFDHDKGVRKAHLSDVLQFIRVPFLSPRGLELYFLAFLNGFHSTATGGNPQNLSGDISELPGRRPDAVVSRCRPRESYGLPKVILCVGGYDGANSKATYMFCPSMSAFWHLGELPYGISCCGLTVMNKNSAFVCGGFLSDTRKENQRISQHDAVRNVWKHVASMQTGRIRPGVAALGGYIYAAGGGIYVNPNWEPIRSVERYDPQTNSWQFVADLPLNGLLGPAMVAAKDRLYIFGGQSQGTSTNAAFCYDPNSNIWNKLADMPTARVGCCACVGANGLVYVIGGKAQEPLSCVEAYDPPTNAWLKRSDMITKRNVAGCGYVDGKIYVLGGLSDNGGVGESSIEVYDENTDSWTMHECRLPKAIRSFGCAVKRAQKRANLHLVSKSG